MKLSKREEEAFRTDYSMVAARKGLDPNPDNPEHGYDYRGAWKDTPSTSKGPVANKPNFGPDEKSGHWPSKHKTKSNPRRVINGTDTKTGRGVGPTKDAIYEDSDWGRKKSR